MREPFVVYPGRRRFALLLALSVALVALGVVGVIADAASVFAWICICLFGTGVFVFSRELLRRRPYLVVDDEGIWGAACPASCAGRRSPRSARRRCTSGGRRRTSSASPRTTPSS